MTKEKDKKFEQLSDLRIRTSTEAWANRSLRKGQDDYEEAHEHEFRVRRCGRTKMCNMRNGDRGYRALDHI
jgi:hypothetical protein